jgi:hypothetical protein
LLKGALKHFGKVESTTGSDRYRTLEVGKRGQVMVLAAVLPIAKQLSARLTLGDPESLLK